MNNSYLESEMTREVHDEVPPFVLLEEPQREQLLANLRELQSMFGGKYREALDMALSVLDPLHAACSGIEQDVVSEFSSRQQ